MALQPGRSSTRLSSYFFYVIAETDDRINPVGLYGVTRLDTDGVGPAPPLTMVTGTVFERLRISVTNSQPLMSGIPFLRLIDDGAIKVNLSNVNLDRFLQHS